VVAGATHPLSALDDAELAVLLDRYTFSLRP